MVGVLRFVFVVVREVQLEKSETVSSLGELGCRHCDAMALVDSLVTHG